MNGTKLSGFAFGFSVGAFSVLVFFEDVPVGGEKSVVLGSSFACSGPWACFFLLIAKIEWGSNENHRQSICRDIFLAMESLA